MTRSEPKTASDPFEGWSSFRELFGPSWRLPRFFDETLPARSARGERWSPAVDIAEDDQKYVITAELPGTAKDDVHVEVHENVMTIRGEKRSEREEKKEQSRWVERSYGSFSRSFTLPANATPDRVNASFKDGVLTIELPKVEAAKPKVISVR
ncbi:MAG: Hsp20/alpha crystallin family protein [Candidatus Limnocylindria bacterium]